MLLVPFLLKASLRASLALFAGMQIGAEILEQRNAASHMEHRLCSCHTAWKHHRDPAAVDVSEELAGDTQGNALEMNFLKKCRGEIRNKSLETVEIIDLISDWPLGSALDIQCRKPVPGDEAYRESIYSRGDPRRMVQFYEKLEACGTDPERQVVNIAVVGGSMTAGNTCDGHKGNPLPNDFLDLPSSKIPFMLQIGNQRCPWSNLFKALLSASFPKCKHIDVWNLAIGATKSSIFLPRVREIFSAPNVSRFGAPLGEVIDLVIHDYGVNDQYVPTKQEMKVPGDSYTQENMLAELESTTEYFLRTLLALPGKPAVVLLETGDTPCHFSSFPAHLEAAERYGVPFISFKHRMSYPDSPYWETFRPPGLGTVDQGSFRNFSVPQVQTPFYPRSPGPIPSNGKIHHYLECWGGTQHPGWHVHRLVAETVLYFLSVSVAAGRRMRPVCEKLGATFKHPMPSAAAMRLRTVLDPFNMCPNGFMTHYDSAALATQDKLSGAEIGENELSGWRLKEDRPHKFGWILDSVSGVKSSDTLSFNLTIGPDPHVTIEYMHSYEGVGKVLVTVDQAFEQDGGIVALPLTSGTARSPLISQNTGAVPIGPGYPPVIIDAYQPAIHNALLTEFDVRPVGFRPGQIVLHATLLELTTEEQVERRGAHQTEAVGKFKITSIRSC